MSAQPRPLEGRKILIVEDEAPIALALASAVAQAGGMAVGPAAIPFVFVSGMSSALMPYPHRDRPLFDKPYEMHDVIATLARLVQPAARATCLSSGATPGNSPR